VIIVARESGEELQIVQVAKVIGLSLTVVASLQEANVLILQDTNQKWSAIIVDSVSTFSLQLYHGEDPNRLITCLPDLIQLETTSQLRDYEGLRHVPSVLIARKLPRLDIKLVYQNKIQSFFFLSIPH
jgi:hypothetical protein